MQLSKHELQQGLNHIYDTLIVGGGTGGLSAGIYLQRFRLSSLLQLPWEMVPSVQPKFGEKSVAQESGWRIYKWQFNRTRYD
jgi:succinate dehydrogenase/fumarate reductase flavoprotein subunit